MYKIMTIILALLCPFVLMAQQDSAAKKANAPQDSAAKKTTIIKPYKELITTKAVTQKGLLTVHKVENKFYLEIPDSLLDRDMLIVTRIVEAAAGVRPVGDMEGYGGDWLNEKVIRFSKAVNRQLFIRKMSFSERAAEGAPGDMARAVKASNVQPVVAAFPILAYTPDSAATVIEIGEYVNGQQDIVFFDKVWTRRFNLGAQENDKSYVEAITSYPGNVEIAVVKTFPSGNYSGYLHTYTLNSSLVLLPAQVMKIRYFDRRVGLFGDAYNDYGRKRNGSEWIGIVNRWRLEPKAADVERYKRGELVEPRKPIVFYIDPATPRKWVPYLIQGVNDWQKAFEKAGFKNAIYALEAPVNDSTWSLNDARHSAIVYKASRIANASGPNVSDPRSGEILESHINWYHNLTEILHSWYFVQAGAVDPAARKRNLDDTLMGKLIRYVCSHEVGHTLGLLHNMGASNTIPVKNLRDKQWLQQNSHTPSIMDYARFNYVAQPEDSIPLASLIPVIGPYDEWAIEWGYRWLGEGMSANDEQVVMAHLAGSKIKADRRLWYAYDGLGDPRIQTEDLGDDQMTANRYGIKNLQRIMPYFPEWLKDTTDPDQNCNDATLMFRQLLTQYRRYLYHAAYYIGSRYVHDRLTREKGPIMEIVEPEKQRAAVRFLLDELFTTPQWLVEAPVAALYDVVPLRTIGSVQNEFLKLVLQPYSMNSILLAEASGKGYTLEEHLLSLKQGIWKELSAHKPITVYRRNLQKMYVQQLLPLLFRPAPGTDPQSQRKEYDFEMAIRSDLNGILKAHAREILKEVKAARPFIKDKMTSLHLAEIQEQLQAALASQKGGAADSGAAGTARAFSTETMLMPYGPEKAGLPSHSCWELPEPGGR
ncbi:MAG: zinc-dependent metalloprotease [Candidatus Pseudobacter hemicellulosilyticus]|uniref:Zinc-dependent metalloprotease n=1 Tax=Candidatus Pseudobacter hemicellulosilyticus TaxID=3121375 RepID=A0AAJ5WNF8_9BACT|nr:MAG: zinc-dependent metalloprotease [Pseudobacter sp.]